MVHATNAATGSETLKGIVKAGSSHGTRRIVMIVGEAVEAVDTLLGLPVLRAAHPLQAVHALVAQSARVLAVLAPTKDRAFSTDEFFAWMAEEFPDILRVRYTPQAAVRPDRTARASSAETTSSVAAALEAQLRSALASSDSQQWQSVTSALAPQLWKHARRFGRSADREDILQETWLSLWQRRGTLRNSTQLAREVDAVADYCARRYGHQARSQAQLARAMGLRPTPQAPRVRHPA